MQHSPASSIGISAIPEPDRGTDLEHRRCRVSRHDLPPPDEAMEPHIHQLPKQIQAPTEVGGPLESLRGEASWHAMGQVSPASAHALEGKTPIGEAHGCPSDLPNLQTQRPAVGSQNPTIRSPVAAQLRHGGLSLTRVLICALIHGPTWAFSVCERSGCLFEGVNTAQGGGNHLLTE